MKWTFCFWKSTDAACRRKEAKIRRVPLVHRHVNPFCLPVTACSTSGHSGEMRNAGVLSLTPYRCFRSTKYDSTTSRFL